MFILSLFAICVLAFGELEAQYNPQVVWIKNASEGVITQALFAPSIGEDGVLYFGGERTYALGKDGSVIWDPPYIAKSFYTNIGSDGSLFLSHLNSPYLYCYNSNGTQKWQRLVPGTGYAAGPPAVDEEGTCFFACYLNDYVTDTTIVAINPDGSTKWRKYNIGGIAYCYPSLDRNGHLFVATYPDPLYNPGKVFKLDRSNGTVLWTGNFTTTSRATVEVVLPNDSIALISTIAGELFAFDHTKGSSSPIWSRSFGTKWLSSPTVDSDGIIYVTAGDDRKLHAIDPSSPQSDLWSYQFSDTVVTSFDGPTIGDNGTLYVSHSNKLFCFSSSSHSLLWTYNLPGPYHLITYGISLDFDGTIYLCHELSGGCMAIRENLTASTGLAGGGWPKARGNYRNNGMVTPSFYVNPLAIVCDTTETSGQSQKTFNIVNPDDATLTIDTIYCAQGVHYTVSTRSGSVPANSSLQVTVQFSPQSAGLYLDTVKVVSGSIIRNVYLSGVGTFTPAPEISIWPTSFDFGEVTVGVTARDTLTVHNTGTASLSLSSLYVTNPAVWSVSPASGSVAAGDSLKVALAFSPTAHGAQNALLCILSNDSDEDSLAVPLAGSGKQWLFKPDTATVRLGETAQVGLFMDNTGTAVSVGQFVVSASPADKVMFLDAVTTGRTSGWSVVDSTATGGGRFVVFYEGSGGTIASGSGNILTLSYALTGNAVRHDTITLSLSHVLIADGSLDSVGFTLGSGRIVVAGCEMPGDVNNDGRVNVLDLALIVKFALGTQSPTDEQRDCADINNDGLINNNDVTLCVNLILGTGGTLLAAAGDLPVDMSAEEVKTLLSGLKALGVEPQKIEQVSLMMASAGMAASLPKAFALAQNSPNPFNPSTTISYQVPDGREVQVRLEVFDLRGRLVTTLVDDLRPAGTYSVFWDGTDSRGGKVASGVYMYRLRAGDFTQTRKMVLLK
ncbi:choice-of-anchor D domain-containing protein [bacterium]|nr:choice-of-anchor D domain-containing protein [bacterium]